MSFFHLAASAVTDAPAGGAELTQVVGASAAAMVATTILFFVGLRERAGHTTPVGRLADRLSRLSGLPRWVALPAAISSTTLIVALTGMYWDISLHVDNGRDAGPLANPSHYLILVGLFGVFAAGWLAMCLPAGRSPALSVSSWPRAGTFRSVGC